MDNMHVQPPSHQLNNSSKTVAPAMPANLSASTPQQSSGQPPDLNATISDGIPLTPENVAAAISNSSNDPTKPRFENGELRAPDNGLL